MAVKKKMVKKRTRNYLAKDFDSLRGDLLKYAKVFYPDNMQDFSEASLGGLFLDMAAYVGDTMAFYLDHQFRELDPTTAIETENIERHAHNAGVKITGASPSVVEVDFYIKVRAIDDDGVLVPQPDALPVIEEGTVLSSKNGVKFTLTEDLDFSKTDYFGNLFAKIIKLKKTGSVDYFALVLTGLCVSGQITTETFKIPAGHKPYRKIVLGKSDISTILQVMDSEGNEYFEVDTLSQDTVFKAFPNPKEVEDDVPSVLGIISAPYRFITSTSLKTRKITVKFGGGSANSLADDGVPDPSDLSLPLYGKKTMSRFSIDPNALLNSQTLGISPENTTISVVFRHGGGAMHNVQENTIVNIDELRIRFLDSLNGVTAIEVKNSIEVKNEDKASGGSAQKSIEEIRNMIPAARNMQSRIVTKEDLMARLYHLPNEYGSVYRAAITENPNNPLGSILYVVSRDSSGRLTQAPDVLKQNISVYLNEFRMISDAIDVLDVQVIDFRLDCNITVAPNANKYDVIKMVIEELKGLLKLDKMQVGQPIIEADIINAIINIQGVLSLIDLKLINLFGTVNGRVYSDQSYGMDEAKSNGIYFPPAGGIFELRFPNEDIRVTVR